MPSQAIVDAEELEHFANDLKQFNSLLSENLSRLNAQFAHLGDTWRDREHETFAQEFRQTVRVLHRFMDTTDQQIPYLHRKAQAIRDYTGRRMGG
jgi:uncharacterized protein YukE